MPIYKLSQTHFHVTIFLRLNYKLHPLSLVKIKFSPLRFDRFNLVLKVWFGFNLLL